MGVIMGAQTILQLNIKDIPLDSTLVVVGVSGNKKIELPAEMSVLSEEEEAEIEAKFSGKVLVIENIVQRMQDKMLAISFEGNISNLELIAVTKLGVFRWDKVKVYKYKLASGRDVQLVVPKRVDGVKFNRRRGVRVVLDKRMDVEQGGTTYSVVVNDLSYCGVSFLEPLGAQINPDEPFVLSLAESSKDGDIVVAKVRGKILHQREDESGGVFSGCVLSPEHAAFLQKYVAIKQMESISGKKQYKGVTKVMTGDHWEEDMAEALKNLKM